MSFVQSMVSSPAGLSLLQAFARVQEVREEKVENRWSGQKRDHSPLALAYLTRMAFCDAFLTNLTVLPDRFFHVFTAAILSVCCDPEFDGFLSTRLAEVAMTIAVIFIAFVGILSPESAVRLTRILLAEALVDDVSRDLDEDLIVNSFITAQLDGFSQRLNGVQLILPVQQRV